MGNCMKRVFFTSFLLFSLIPIIFSFSPVFGEQETVREKGFVILNDVIGLDLTNYQVIATEASLSSYLGVVAEENVQYTLESGGITLDVLYTFTDAGNLRMIDVLDVIGSPTTSQSTANPVNMGKDFLDNYKNYSKNAFYGKLAAMLDLVDDKKTSDTLTSDNINLEVKNSEDSTTFKWTYTVNGIKATSKCVVLGYKNGFLKYFIDNWDLYTIDNTEMNLSEKEAINIALKNAKDFSWNVNSGESTYEVNDFNVTQAMILGTGFCSSVDADVPRSEYPLTLYPMKHIWVSLDKFYPGNVYGIEVILWADTKEVCCIQERFSPFDPPANLIANVGADTVGVVDVKTDVMSIAWIAFPTFATVLLVTVSTWLIKKKNVLSPLHMPKLRFFRKGAGLFSLFLVTVLLVVPSSTVFAVGHVGRATIWGSESTYDTSFYGSTGRKTSTEITNQQNVANFINTKFSANGYVSSNYQGDGSIKANILSNISYNEANYPRVAVVDFDHGVGRPDYTDPEEFHFMFEDNVGWNVDGDDPNHENLVYDMDIYNRTGQGNTFFAFINACKSADISGTLGEWTLVEGGGLYTSSGNAVGLPFAWTHRQVVDGGDDGCLIDSSVNMTMYGYTEPDSGPHCYIGYNNGSAALSQNVDLDYPAVKHVDWVSAFFNYSLCFDMTINQALDHASYYYYSTGLGDTRLYTGFNATWPMWDSVNQNWTNTGTFNNSDHLVVYGNGELTLYQNLLTISAGTGGYTIPSGSDRYVYGYQAMATAYAYANYDFSHWTLNGSYYSSNPTVTVGMYNDYNLQAIFTYDPPTMYTLSISSSGSGYTSPSGSPQYQSGTYATVYANPSQGWTFDHWVLDSQNAGSSSPINVYMNTNRNLQAVFVEDQPPPTHYVTVEVWGYYPPWTLMYQEGQYLQEGPQQFSAPSAYGGLPFYAWYHNGNYYYTQSIWISIYSDTSLAALYSY